MNIKVLISNSHINNKKELTEIAMINLLQDIEGINIESLSEFSKYLDTNDLGVFLTYRQIDLIKKPKFNELVKLTTYPFKTNQISGYRHIYMLDANNNPYVKTTAFGAFVNIKTNMPVRIPKEIVKTIGDKEADKSINIMPRKIELIKNEHKLLDVIKIRRSHIDRYNHVNNSHYVAFVLDSYEKEFDYKQIRIEYRNPFVLNDKCYVYLAFESLNKLIFTLEDDKNNIHAIIEVNA